jgi:hypothetical protein
MFLSACDEKFLDLESQDSITEAAYFTEPDHFRAAANDFYNKMISWKATKASGLGNEYNSNIYDFMDFGSDLVGYIQDYGRGVVNPGTTDKYWTNTYAYIRANNLLLEKAGEFEGDPAAIAEYVAAAKFFRAWHHFFLLQRFGGVPVVTTVLDVDSPELLGNRNSRYEVVQQIIKDLDEAIADLPLEQNISSSDKGHLSRWAAEAFKAKVLLYEATWERYVATSTDGDGSAEGAGSAKPTGYPTVDAMLQQAITSSKDVMDNGGFELWNFNSALDNLSSYFLFSLEDAGSNPAGLDKSTNKEYILYNKYDFALLQGGINLSHTVGTRLAPDRKFMDMFLCSDGLPVDKSTEFQGYEKTSDEYKNRDYRLVAYFGTKADGSVTLIGPGSNSGAGYSNRKFAAYNYGVYRAANTESADYSQIRLAEVFLMYAEALYELNGTITDEQLNASINKTRARAGLPPLTNAFAGVNGLDMLEEIRRERTVELFGENSRFNDLKRWGIAEEALNAPIVGDVIEGTDYENNPDLYTPSAYPYGEITVGTGVGPRRALQLDPSVNRNFQRKHYLFPIPLEEMNLNKSLVQNPGY